MREKENFDGQEYRKELAEKLKEIRHSDSEESDVARARAQGYLDAKQETPEYKAAAISHKAEIEKKLQKSEIAEHGIEWLKECSNDNGEALERYMASIKDIIDAGLEEMMEPPHQGVNYVDKSSYFEEYYIERIRRDIRYNQKQFTNEVYDRKKRLEEAEKAFFAALDKEKLKLKYPRALDRRDYFAQDLADLIGYTKIHPNEYFNEQGNKLTYTHSSNDRFKEFIKKFVKAEKSLSNDEKKQKNKEKRVKKLEQDIEEKKQILDKLKKQ